MCYMEQKMQEQYEAVDARLEELQKQYDLFCEWYLSSFPDGDETLIDRKYLDDSFNLGSPVTEVSCMWLGWRSGLNL